MIKGRHGARHGTLFETHCTQLEIRDFNNM